MRRTRQNRRSSAPLLFWHHVTTRTMENTFHCWAIEFCTKKSCRNWRTAQTSRLREKSALPYTRVTGCVKKFEEGRPEGIDDDPRRSGRSPTSQIDGNVWLACDSDRRMSVRSTLPTTWPFWKGGGPSLSAYENTSPVPEHRVTTTRPRFRASASSWQSTTWGHSHPTALTRLRPTSFCSRGSRLHWKDAISIAQRLSKRPKATALSEIPVEVFEGACRT